MSRLAHYTLTKQGSCAVRHGRPGAAQVVLGRTIHPVAPSNNAEHHQLKAGFRVGTLGTWAVAQEVLGHAKCPLSTRTRPNTKSVRHASCWYSWHAGCCRGSAGHTMHQVVASYKAKCKEVTARAHCSSDERGVAGEKLPAADQHHEQTEGKAKGALRMHAWSCHAWYCISCLAEQ